MESASFSIFLLSIGVYLWAVVGLIKPAWGRLRNRWDSVGVWALSVVLLIGGSLMHPGDTTPASSVSRMPQASAVGEPAEVDCADWDRLFFFEEAEVSDVVRCLQAGVDPKARNAVGWTPLHRAAGFGGTAEVVTALLEAGADQNARTFGITPLHDAMEDAEVVTALLEAGADLEARTDDGHTPLHFAAREAERAEGLAVLIEAGADLEARNKYGWTSLNWAASFGTAETVTALLEAGADPNTRNDDGKRPLDYARDNDQLKGTDAYWKLNDARFQ